jgi:hypothetical protein
MCSPCLEEVNTNLKYWSTLLVAAIGLALIGCGGSGGGGGKNDDGGSGDGGGNGGGPQVVLPPNGTIDVALVPGAGRAPGDMWGIFRRAYFDDGIEPQPFQQVTDQKLQLNAYGTPLQIPVSVDFRQTTQDTRRFQDYTFDMESMQFADDAGNIRTLEQINNVPFTFTGAADIRVFKGRRTGFQVFLDSTMFSVDDTQLPTFGIFNPQRFLEVNVPDSSAGSKMQGFLADYVSFDISQIPDTQKPRFSDNNAIANRVFFSGDGYAIGGAPGANNKYEALTLNTFQPISGRFQPPTVIAGKPAPGTYSLLQNDPSQIDPENAKLISLVGIWYEHFQVVTDQGATQMIAFPRSRDDNFQDVVLVTQTKQNTANGVRYTIKDLKWGYIEYSVDTSNNKLFLFSARDLTNGAGATPVATGKVTDLVGPNGTTANTTSEVRSAKYTLTGGGSGTLIVFRK